MCLGDDCSHDSPFTRMPPVEPRPDAAIRQLGDVLHARTSRRATLKTLGLGLAGIAGAGLLPGTAAKAWAQAGNGRPAVPPPTAGRAIHLPSRPETVVWGYIPTDHPAVLNVGSGSTVRIDTLSHQGVLTADDPVTFFGQLGVAPDEVLQDAIDIWEARVELRPPGASAHVLTGPIYIDGAEPGDTLEIRVVDAELRVPYGINRSGPNSGVLPDLLDAPSVRLLRADRSGRSFPFAPGIDIPAAPFPGIMTVAPPASGELVSSRPPRAWGGNIDLRELVAGSSLYLPVFNEGAQFFVGDPHAAQGDGEVNGTAIEHSITYTLQFVLHKAMPLDWPMAETATHYIPMGIDEDLYKALQISLQETVDFLVGFTDGVLSPADAYSLSSLAVDFEIAEAVNFTKVVHGMIPKSLFASTPRFWSRGRG